MEKQPFGENMNSDNEEIVPGLYSSDVKDITNQIFNRKDGNHPHCSSDGNNGFLDILENGKSDISASPIFIRKVSL
jgi:hypothetical protein